MPKLVCHICQSLKGLIVLRSGLSICPRCLYNLDLRHQALPPVVRRQFIFSPVIDYRGTLDFIGAQLMANFLHNGMSVRAVARQMGITHSTVYAKLRRNHLIKPNGEDKIRLNPTLSDVGIADGLNRMRSVKTGKRIQISNKKCVTPNSPMLERSRSQAAAALGSGSNAEGS